MQIRDLIPWSRRRKQAVQAGTDGETPLANLQRDINQVFDQFWSRFERPFGALSAAPVPAADVTETDDAVVVSLELPGLGEKDVEVNVGDDTLSIRGEKKAEKEESRKGYYLSERSYGAFYRSIPLPAGVDAEKAEARFRRGVLTVTLPKTAEGRERARRVEVKAA
jgi:HSP20 family protein